MQAAKLKNTLTLYIVGILLWALCSCKKETVIQESKFDLLTKRSWQLTNLYHQEMGDNTISDFTAVYYKDCEKDDSYHFAANNMFFRRDSTNQCANQPQFGLYGGASWTADSSFSKITFDSFPYYLYNMEIKTLTSSRLELRHHVLDYFQKEVTFTFRFKSIMQ